MFNMLYDIILPEPFILFQCDMWLCDCDCDLCFVCTDHEWPEPKTSWPHEMVDLRCGLHHPVSMNRYRCSTSFHLTFISFRIRIWNIQFYWIQQFISVLQANRDPGRSHTYRGLKTKVKLEVNDMRYHSDVTGENREIRSEGI